MKKILTSALVLGMLSFGFVANAAAPNWDVSGDWVFDYNYGGSNLHDMTLVQATDGSLTGTGGAFSGVLPYAYPWTVVSGSVDGDTITLTADYDNLNCLFTLTGTIAGGSMSGTWTDDCDGPRAGTWATTNGTATEIAEEDLCPTSEVDADWDVSWGNNRWEIRDNAGVLTWYQNKVGKKGVTTPTAGETIDYTYGCNGHQILEMLNEELGAVMKGHWKYGISSGLLKEFHDDLSDGLLDGMYLVDTVVVPANDVDGVSSTVSLVNGEQYVFTASGTAYACNESGCTIQFDADYSDSNGDATWEDGVAAPYDTEGTDLLDLEVNGSAVNWGTYNASHTYNFDFTGSGSTVNFGVYDLYYPNNTGTLTVNIYAQI